MSYCSLSRLWLFTTDHVLLLLVELFPRASQGLDSETERQEESIGLDLSSGEGQGIYPKMVTA